MADKEVVFFTQIPVWVDEVEGISDFQARLMGYIYTFQNLTGSVFPSNKTIAKRFKKTPSTVQHALSDLYKKGVLRSEVKYKEDSKEIDKRYLFVINPMAENGHTPTQNNAIPPSNKMPDPMAENCQDNRLFNKSTNRLVNKDILSSSDEPDRTPYKDVVDCLNEMTGTKYRPTAKATQRLIKARFNDGFTLDDFKQVIKTKSDEWKNDPSMVKYLRPETLFGTKFESYLNQQPTQQQGKAPANRYDDYLTQLQPSDNHKSEYDDYLK